MKFELNCILLVRMPLTQRLCILLAVVLVCVLSTSRFAFGAGTGDGVICTSKLKGLATWERQMNERGRYWGEYLSSSDPAFARDRLVNEFYDSAHTFYRISEYRGEKEPWFSYAEAALAVYRDGYLIPNDWKAAGWRRSSHGLYYNFLSGGDVTLDQLELIRDMPAYSNIREGRGLGGSERRSRAIALAVQAHVHAERAGSERRMEGGVSQLSVFVKWMGSHLYEWRTGNYQGEYPSKGPRFAPFMMGMTAHALVEYYEWEVASGEDPNRYWPRMYPIDYGQGVEAASPRVFWPTIVDALSDVAMWAATQAKHDNGESMFHVDKSGDVAFLYESTGRGKPAYDLNLMIAHMYAWLWKETGNLRFRTIGDQLFTSGARHGSTLTGKHFNQQYRMAFDFHKWRQAGDAKYCHPPQRSIN
jgi:hypothetical protein